MTGSRPDPGFLLTRRTLLRGLAGLGAACLAPPWPRSAGAVSVRETARAWRCMGTLIEVRVPDLPEPDAVDAIRRVRSRLRDLEAVWTVFREESPVVRLNRSRPGSWIPVPPATLSAVGSAVAAVRETGGRFDPTVGPVLREVGLLDLRARTPSPGFLERWRTRPGIEAVEIDDRGCRLRRLDPRVEIDLGGIGKGLGVDAALEILRHAGSRSALVNLGGSLGTLGAPPDRPRGWPVGIAHPRNAGEVWTRFLLTHGHVATSGDAERRIVLPGGLRHHLIDPRTGESGAGVPSVTTWAATGRDADVASTSRFLETSLSGEAGTLLAVAELAGGATKTLPRAHREDPTAES